MLCMVSTQVLCSAVPAVAAAAAAAAAGRSLPSKGTHRKHTHSWGTRELYSLLSEGSRHGMATPLFYGQAAGSCPNASVWLLREPKAVSWQSCKTFKYTPISSCPRRRPSRVLQVLAMAQPTPCHTTHACAQHVSTYQSRAKQGLGPHLGLTDRVCASTALSWHGVAWHGVACCVSSCLTR
jgi:hypothetical protein